jgi:predicted aspartyl protease
MPLARLTRPAALTALLLLAACASAPTGPCRLQQAADLPATLDNNRLEVVGRVNGAAVNLLIDTGAERTVITTATVAALQLPRSQRSATRLTGIGGAVSNADVFAQLELGQADFSRRLAVANIPTFGGIVGGDMLSDYDLELDLPNRRVRLWRARGCGAADLPWTGPLVTVPVDVDNDRIHLQVRIDGHPVPAILDSGASISLLETDTAAHLGVNPAALEAEPKSLARGVDGGTINVHTHRFTSLAVGADHVAGPRIGVAAFDMGGGVMLLGMDYLRSRRVWIAYRLGQIFIQDSPRAP